MTTAETVMIVAGALSILAGIAVIAWPRILAYMVGLYLMIVGIIAIVATLVSDCAQHDRRLAFASDALP